MDKLRAEIRREWLLGEGSHLINPEASTYALTNEAVAYLESVRMHTDLVSNLLPDSTLASPDQFQNMFETMDMLTRMSLQCVRMVRTRLAQLEFDGQPQR